jgi:hypothetical protein
MPPVRSAEIPRLQYIIISIIICIITWYKKMLNQRTPYGRYINRARTIGRSSSGC